MLRTVLLIGMLSFSAGFASGQSTGDVEFKKLNTELVQHYSKGDFEKALVAANRLVEIVKRDGKDSLALGVALKNRGMVEQAKGDEKAAAKSFDEAVDVFKKHKDVLGKAEGENLAELLENLGRIRGKKDLLWTETIFKEALEWRERSNGPDAVETATPLVYLANIKFWQRDFKKSAELYSRALANLGNSPTASKEDITLVYYRTQCTYRKAKVEDEFVRLKEKYGSAAEFDKAPRKPKFINAGVVNGKALSLPKPLWPAEARGGPGAEGTVEVDVLINESGTVISACGKSDGAHQALVEASELAAYKSKFSPTTLDGNAVKVSGRVVYTFRR